jgi:putative SOS response-associated peptidase YedK
LAQTLDLDQASHLDQIMCSRYSLTSPPEAVRSYFRHRQTEGFPPRYNIAPTQPVHIVHIGHTGERELRLVRWGLLPPWVKDPSTFGLLTNARAETINEKPSFKGAIRHKRCLVPADGFYEWTGPKGDKRPHLIRPKGGGVMAFAGLHETWGGGDGSEMETTAIITVAANATMASIHDRMPAILQPSQFDAWLNCWAVDVDAAVSMLAPAADDLLEIMEINSAVNNSRNEGPELHAMIKKNTNNGELF